MKEADSKPSTSSASGENEAIGRAGAEEAVELEAGSSQERDTQAPKPVIRKYPKPLR